MRAASNTMSAGKLSASAAFSFVLTMGVVNLFGDLTYEGGASISGPFLQSLGASAAAVSIIAGVGEFFGYSLRLGAGYIADRTQKYWLITFVGYAINLVAVPAMALAGNWPIAAALVITERVGRAIRKPTVEAMLSYTTGKHGKGWVYGVNTALDEAGATIGPLVVALVLFFKGSYRTAYALLLVSVVLAFVSLAVARVHFPEPSHLETGRTAQAKGFTKEYWLNMGGGRLFCRRVNELRADFVSPLAHARCAGSLDSRLSRHLHGDRRARQSATRQNVRSLCNGNSGNGSRSVLDLFAVRFPGGLLRCPVR